MAPINAVLKDAEYVTFLRDPVERLISYYFHVKRTEAAGWLSAYAKVDFFFTRNLTYWNRSSRLKRVPLYHECRGRRQWTRGYLRSFAASSTAGAILNRCFATAS